MAAPLYNAEILRLATSNPHVGRLAAPDASAELRSPLCGSRVIADVLRDGDRLAGLGLDVRSCALGQASASLLARNALGRSMAELDEAGQRLEAFLTGAEGGHDFWPGIEALAAARDYPARHAAILLPFRATAQALRAAIGAAAQDGPC